jgi:hypothetical protein
VVLSSYYVGNRVVSNPRFNLTIDKVELDARWCEWLPEEAKRRIEEIPVGLKNLNLLSEGVLEKVRDRLADNPWVKEIRYIEKVFPDRIRFSVVIRKPVAWVMHGAGLYLTDFEGVRLAVEDRDGSKIRDLPVIQGISRGVSLPPPGGKWNSRQVRQGIYVAGYLLMEPDLLAGDGRRVRYIDVAGTTRDKDIVVLITEDKQRFEWGRTELAGAVEPLSDQEKLANLQLILEGESSLTDRSYYLLWTKPPTAGPPEQTAENPR